MERISKKNRGKKNKMTEITWMQPYYDLILNKIPLDTDLLIDVGSGYGVLGYILSQTRDIATMISVDPVKRYDQPFFKKQYNMTWAVFNKHEEFHVDVIVSTEMIEHMDKKDALLFLDEVKWRSRKVIIATPYYFTEQEKYDENEFQSHRCSISVNEFKEKGYDVTLVGSFITRFLIARVSYNPKLVNMLKLIGIKPTNIIAEWKKK